MAGSSQRSYQHVYRIDKESRQDISRELEHQIMAFLDRVIPEMDAVIISDYRNGVITPELLPYTIRLGKKHNKIVTADSRGNFLDYNVLAHDAVHGQHLGILLIEFGVGATVAAVMTSLFYGFAG